MNSSYNQPNAQPASTCLGKKCGVVENSGNAFGVRGAALAGALGLALTSCQPKLGTLPIDMARVIYGPAAMPITRTLQHSSTIEQRQIAACNGNNAASNKTVKQKINSGQARKVAVVVPSKDGNPGGIMKVNPATGKPESSRIYQPGSGGGLKTGDVIRLDGTPCVVYVNYSSGM